MKLLASSPRRAARRLLESPRLLHWLLAAGFVCLGAVPRLVQLERPGLTYDEYYDFADSLRFCRSGSALRPISDGYLNGQAPFFLACPAYRLFGGSEVVARGLSALAGLAAILATALVAVRVLPKRWAAAGVLLLALSSFFAGASRLAFSHGHVFAVPSLLLALRELLGPARLLGRPRPALGGGLLLGIAVGSDLLAAPWGLTLLLLGWQRLPPGWAGRGRFALRFVGAAVLGLSLASPMYAASPFEAAVDVASRVAWWDAQTPYLWLGAEVASVPAYYYALVLLVKVSPAVAASALLSLTAWRSPPVRLLWLCLWPILLLSLKPWKSPYYLTTFLPLLYLLAAHGLWRLWRRRAAFAGLRAGMLGVAIGLEALLLVDAHPDHLMAGIRYSPRLYGDFQGPAVSHGQWVSEALERVRADAGRDDVVVLVPAGFAPRQVAHYAERLRLSRVHTADELRRGVNPKHVEYVILSQDVLTHSEELQLNAALVRLTEDVRAFEPLLVVRASGFPLARVWRRRAGARPGAAGLDPEAPSGTLRR